MPEHDHTDAAEEVRAYLATLRGGALLSSTDGHLLVRWLDEGVSVGAILRSLDRAADTRRAKRIRAPLALRHARAFLAREAARSATRHPPRLVVEVEDPLLGGWVSETLSAIASLDLPDAEERARAACALAARLFDRIWSGHDALREELVGVATAEMIDLKEDMGEGEFTALVEDLARYRLRQRFPALSATRIWEECGLAAV